MGCQLFGTRVLCSNMEQGRAWATQLAADVGKRVAYFRERAAKNGHRLTAQTLSDRCTALGYPIARSVIAKLEKGLRESITLGEIMVLARALGVPPLLLIFPIGLEETTTVTPRDHLPPWDAALWFRGEMVLADTPEEVEPNWQTENGVIGLYEHHDELTNTFENRFWESLEDPRGKLETAKGQRKLRNDLVDEVREVRAAMREHGLTFLPPLPDELAEIDDQESPRGAR